MRALRGLAWIVLAAAPGVSGCAGAPAPKPAPSYASLSLAELQQKADAGADARACRELAFRLLNDGKLDDALAQANTAVKLDSRSSDGHNVRGMVYAALGRADLAEADFKQASKLAPTKAGPRMNLGRLFIALGDHQAAAVWLQQASDLDPRNAEAASLAGAAWQQAGSALIAKRYFRRALDIRPDDAKALAGLGEALINGGRAVEARGMLERARELGDVSPRTESYLGLALTLSAASPAEAREAVERLMSARAAGERGSHLYYALGRAYLACHDHPAAIRMLNEGLKAHPDVAGLHYTLADAYAASGRSEESRVAREKSARLAAVRGEEEKLLKSIAEQPEQPSRYLPYVDWLIKRRDFETALAPLRQVLRMDPDNATARRQLQVVANALKRPELIRETASPSADNP